MKKSPTLKSAISGVSMLTTLLLPNISLQAEETGNNVSSVLSSNPCGIQLEKKRLNNPTAKITDMARVDWYEEDFYISCANTITQRWNIKEHLEALSINWKPLAFYVYIFRSFLEKWQMEELINWLSDSEFIVWWWALLRWNYTFLTETASYLFEKHWNVDWYIIVLKKIKSSNEAIFNSGKTFYVDIAKMIVSRYKELWVIPEELIWFLHIQWMPEEFYKIFSDEINNKRK